MTIELDRPYLASDASAIVVDPSGAPMPGTTVKLMSVGWGKIIASKETNSQGFFRFSSGNSNLLYLEITRPGFQVMHVKLKVVRKKIKVPLIKVQIAT